MARRRRSSGRKGYGRRVRRFARSHTTHIAALGGGALAGYGLLGPIGGASGGGLSSWNIADVLGMGQSTPANGVSNMLQSIPLYGQQSDLAANRAMVGAGAGLVLASMIARKIPMLRKIGFRLGARRRVAVF